MNIEIMRNTLYKAYLDDFAAFCQSLGGTTAEVMGDLLAFEVSAAENCNITGFTDSGGQQQAGWIAGRMYTASWLCVIDICGLAFFADRPPRTQHHSQQYRHRAHTGRQEEVVLQLWPLVPCGSQ
jgi:hypothetical protein